MSALYIACLLVSCARRSTAAGVQGAHLQTKPAPCHLTLQVQAKTLSPQCSLWQQLCVQLPVPAKQGG